MDGEADPQVAGAGGVRRPRRDRRAGRLGVVAVLAGDLASMALSFVPASSVISMIKGASCAPGDSACLAAGVGGRGGFVVAVALVGLIAGLIPAVAGSFAGRRLLGWPRWVLAVLAVGIVGLPILLEFAAPNLLPWP